MLRASSAPSLPAAHDRPEPLGPPAYALHMSPKDLFLGGPVPFFLALLIVAVLTRHRSSGRRALGAAIGLAVAYLAFHVHLIGFLQPWQRSSLSSVRAHEWLAWLVPLAAGVGALLGGGRAPALLHNGLPATLGGALLTAVLYPKIKGFWDAGTSAGAMVGLFALWLLMWFSMSSFARRRGSASAAALLGLTCLCASVSVGLTGTASYAQLIGAVTAGLAGVAVVGLGLERDAPVEPALALGALPVGLVVFSLLTLAHSEPVYGELTVLNGLLLCAPLLLAGPLGRFGGRSIPRDIVRVVLLLLPALAALGHVIYVWNQSSGEASYY